MVIVPVGMIHVGCLVVLAVGAEIAGAPELITARVESEMQAVAFDLILILYVPGINPDFILDD